VHHTPRYHHDDDDVTLTIIATFNYLSAGCMFALAALLIFSF